jgi:hypothetical protein
MIDLSLFSKDVRGSLSAHDDFISNSYEKREPILTGEIIQLYWLLM